MGLTKEFIPGGFDLLTVSLDLGPQVSELSSGEAVIVRYGGAGAKPQFCLAIGLSNVDMRRLPR
jgi:hypothetical protein